MWDDDRFRPCRRCGRSVDRDCKCGDPADDARRRAARQKRFDRIVPRKFRWAAFDAPELAQWVHDTAAIAKAKAMVDAPLVTLVGRESGVGKTTLATAMLHACLVVREPAYFAHRPTGAFAMSLDLIRARTTSQLGEEDERITAAFDADVLVLDDVGQGPESRWDSMISEIVHYRHSAELRTFVTTFLAKDELARRYGDHCARRLLEAGYIHVGGSR